MTNLIIISIVNIISNFIIFYLFLNKPLKLINQLDITKKTSNKGNFGKYKEVWNDCLDIKN